MALIPQVVDAVKIPVIAAGSIVDGRGLAAALALGAQGVWMGTRFIASTEAHAGGLYKQVIVDASDEDTIITRSYSGKPMRVFKNEWVADWEKRPQDIKPFPQQAMLSAKPGVMGGIGGQIEGLVARTLRLRHGSGRGRNHRREIVARDHPRDHGGSRRRHRADGGADKADGRKSLKQLRRQMDQHGETESGDREARAAIDHQHHAIVDAGVEEADDGRQRQPPQRRAAGHADDDERRRQQVGMSAGQSPEPGEQRREPEQCGRIGDGQRKRRRHRTKQGRRALLFDRDLVDRAAFRLS